MNEYDATEAAFQNGYAKGIKESAEELEKAKCEIYHLRDELQRATRELQELRVIRRTVEVIFGRRFDNG